MKRKLILAFAILLALFVFSSSKAQTLVLWHADNTTTDVELYLMPSVTFQNDKVLITSTILNMEYPKENVLRFTYKGKATGITSPTTKGNYSRENGNLVFHGVNSAKDVAVYTVSGIRVPVNVTFKDSDAILPLSSIHSGSYILSVNGKTSKFIKP